MKYMPLVVNELPYSVHLGQDRAGNLHWHSEMELYISLQGSQQVDVEGQNYRLQAGDALIIPGYAAHNASSADPDNYHVAINFGYGLLKNRYPAVQHTCLSIPKTAAGLPEALVTPIRALEAIFRANGQISDQNEWQIRGNLFLLCGYLQTVAPKDPPSTDLQDRIRMLDNIFAVVRHVDKHYSQRITVEEMATLAGYAKTYFCRQFKRITGVPFYQYLTRYRIQAACLMLDNAEQNMAAIARATGFSTQTLFCRTFKECTGLTPTQYQNLSQEEKSAIWMD